VSDIAITVEDLGKEYHIGHVQTGYRTLRESLTDVFISPFRKASQLARGHAAAAQSLNESFWALRNVSFEVKRGEVLGVIGRNGAGKSTLLKILSRITEPTEGFAHLHGRVASLLEVGTGFHPELTGRENVYLNGSILGMTRREIQRRFDEIVAFAEIAKFVDTPVKHYSSGMHMRLAFAVAAHLESEILIIDEVLAVGDTGFQRRCLSKIGDVARSGRTVLFVSHNILVVESLCTSAMLLQNGTLCAKGEPGTILRDYSRAFSEGSRADVALRTDRRGGGKARLTSINIHQGGPHNLPLATGAPARFAFQVKPHLQDAECFFTIYDLVGHPIAHFASGVQTSREDLTAFDGAEFVCEIPHLHLLPGQYRINAAIRSNGHLEDHLEAAALFDVQSAMYDGRTIRESNGYGSIFVPHRWQATQVP
jgi:lipopolysaccharide transport system ATP-binding protein